MRIVVGLDTEYGLLIEGRTADSQIEDSMALVRSYAGEGHFGWNYRYESPRTDLRGFDLKHLAHDPEDAKFDRGRPSKPADEVRSDIVLPNGARFYNDHGHPEYATPECLGLEDLVHHDAAGDRLVRRAAAALEQQIDAQVTIYKNNTDFHGASWGSHESYLAPRHLGFEGLYQAVMPILVARIILTGAGKVGAESGAACDYQMSQRADFMVEAANAETLFRRPVFNTRDEPHADRVGHIRLHVIAGDSNMIPSATARKVGLVRLAIKLAADGRAPIWNLRDPVAAMKGVSRDLAGTFDIPLATGTATPREILESYFAMAEEHLDLDDDDRWTITHCRELLQALGTDRDHFRGHVDWAAKKFILDSAGLAANDPTLRAYDLEYHNLDPNVSLYGALVEMGEVEAPVTSDVAEDHLRKAPADTRALVRSLAIQKFPSDVIRVGWRSVTLRANGDEVELDLPPDAQFGPELANTESVEEFIEEVRRTSDRW